MSSLLGGFNISQLGGFGASLIGSRAGGLGNIWGAIAASNKLINVTEQAGTITPMANLPGACYAMVFDGSNIWYSTYNYTLNTGQLVKVNAATGAVLATLSTGAPNNFLAFDGANIWYTDILNSAYVIVKRRISDGAIILTHTIGSTTYGLGYVPAYSLAFDGANIWFTTAKAGFGTLLKMRASDGAILLTLPVNTVAETSGATAGYITYDGENIWYSFTDKNGSGNILLVQRNATTGTIMNQYNLGSVSAGYISAQYIIFDGTNLWYWQGNSITGEYFIYNMSPVDGTILASFPAYVYAMVFDGTSLWYSAPGAVLIQMRISDGTILSSSATAFPAEQLTYAGENPAWPQW